MPFGEVSPTSNFVGPRVEREDMSLPRPRKPAATIGIPNYARGRESSGTLISTSGI